MVHSTLGKGEFADSSSAVGSIISRGSSSGLEHSADNREVASSSDAPWTNLLRIGAEAAREAHNLQAIGSSPISATNFSNGA